MKKFQLALFSIGLFLLCSCSKYSLHITKLNVNEESLASVFVRTKDPRKKYPLLGEELVMYWSLKKAVFEKAEGLILDIIYKNFQTDSIYYPLEKALGMKGFFLLGEKFKNTQGFLTYRAKIVDQNKKTLASWSHKMWFNLLRLREIEKGFDEPQEVNPALFQGLNKGQ